LVSDFRGDGQAINRGPSNVSCCGPLFGVEVLDMTVQADLVGQTSAQASKNRPLSLVGDRSKPGVVQVVHAGAGVISIHEVKACGDARGEVHTNASTCSELLCIGVIGNRTSDPAPVLIELDASFDARIEL